MKDIRLRDLPSFVRATDPNDCLFNLCLECAERASEGIFLTFDASEQEKSFTLCFLMPTRWVHFNYFSMKCKKMI
ncbi:hypothetical protein Peur_043982 [Populus x canadensis]